MTEPLTYRRARRLLQLAAGLCLFGFSLALIIAPGLGNAPWDVLHQGLSRTMGLGIGTWMIITGVVVLLLWIPLRQRPGIGTVANTVCVGLVLDLTLPLIGTPHGLPLRTGLLCAGVALNGVATALYIGARLGPGARDGLMTGLAAHGAPLFAVRTAIEVTVLVAGVLLGGTLGLGTALYAVAIGPLTHVLLPVLDVGPSDANL